MAFNLPFLKRFHLSMRKAATSFMIAMILLGNINEVVASYPIHNEVFVDKLIAKLVDKILDKVLKIQLNADLIKRNLDSVQLNKDPRLRKESRKKIVRYSGKMRPGKLSARRTVPKHIPRPEYAVSGFPQGEVDAAGGRIEIKSAKDIEGMRAAGRIAREVLDAAGRAVAVGVTTDYIDEIVHNETIARGAYPSPLNYHGFPKSCCTSVNEVIAHGIPDSYKLEDGDIINIDVTVYFGEYHGDLSETFLVGNVDEKGKHLVKVCHDAWQAAIKYCKPGQKYQGIGNVIEGYIEKYGYTTCEGFSGHGIGKLFHTEPDILHFRNKAKFGRMKVGHVFTIEPMINEGSDKWLKWDDDWTVTTKDGKRSAQFEHTLLITADGVEELTKRLPSSNKFWWESSTKEVAKQEEHKNHKRKEPPIDWMDWGPIQMRPVSEAKERKSESTKLKSDNPETIIMT
eukprot:gnl/MRDRNA2_/MRDRNA2_16386_c0_seq1.p1 gnl/MRDRNA2_/MRDRNA2_16386_c0~~gnl/MRDRNA2_/MRDRNA2_16386_c0_seq1.p1  ORF type:complete len:491 (+),score=93.76 gnl/MRDRNA2_/MRDRNA2_16386_c0_seq1:111-1475(+)